jgi:hypothetical protein
MLEKLRNQIAQSVEPNRFRVPPRICRMVVLGAGPSLITIKSMFDQCFPAKDEQLAILCPWLPASADEVAFHNDVRQVTEKLYDANQINQATKRGISVERSAIQVIVIADLTESNVCDDVRKWCTCIEQELQNYIEVGTVVYWIGVYLLRRSASAEMQNLSGDSQGINSPETSRLDKSSSYQTLTALQAYHFHRVFLLDASGPSGKTLGPRDQVSQLAQLIYFLWITPLTAGPLEGYQEWLVRGRWNEGEVTGFSAYSLNLPVDQILEVVSLAKGADVVEESLLQVPRPGRHMLYLNNLLQENSLVTLDEVKEAVSHDPDFKIADPLCGIPEFQRNRPQDYLAAVDNLDASLATFAREHGEAIQAIGKKRSRQWKVSLEDHLESTTLEEYGGLRVAQEFLTSFQVHLQQVIPKEVAPPQFEDPGPAIRRLRALIESRPRDEAILGRVAVLAIASSLVCVSLPLPLVTQAVITGIATAFCLGLGLLLSHLVRQEFENACSDIEKHLRGKWNALLNLEKEKTAKVCLEELLSETRNSTVEIQRAIDRLSKLLAYFRNSHEPTFGEESAAWNFVTKQRDELLRYSRLCNLSTPEVAKEYVEKDRPLNIWRRLSRPSTDSPDEWGARLFENAASRVLSYCKGIVDTHIVSHLGRDDAALRTSENAILEASEPYLRLRAGSACPSLHGILESSDAGSPILENLHRRLSSAFGEIRHQSGPSVYRLSFFGMLEDAAIKDVLLR